MPEFTAKDVQALRQSTGAGMMDAKKALTEADGDFEAAVQILREKGLAKAAGRSDRENSEGIVVVAESKASPCGACRQMLAEFGDLEVLMVDPAGTITHTRRLTELLPEQFKLRPR